MKRLIILSLIIYSFNSLGQNTPYAGIKYSAIIADKINTENNSILDNSKGVVTNFEIHALYGDSINKKWIAYGEIKYSHLRTSTNISSADKTILNGTVPELTYSNYCKNNYELSFGGIRNINKNINVFLNNTLAHTKFNYSSSDVKSFEYLFVGYSNFKIKKYFNLGIGGLYYTNFHSNTVLPIVALGLNFNKLNIDANLPLNLGISYKINDKLNITGNGNLSFGTLQIPEDNPDYALATEMDMLDIYTTLGFQYKIKKVMFFTNFGLKYMEKTYRGTSNLNMVYPENLYLEFGFSLLD